MRTMTEFISTEYDGRTVNDFLRHKLGCSGTLIKALKRQENGLLLNGRHIRTVDNLRAGDQLTITLPEKGGFSHESVPMELNIIHQDSDIIALDKPPGLPVHRSARHNSDTLANGVAYYFERQGINAPFRAVNRLDRDTSGLVLLGLNTFAAARLARNVQKVYYAVVDGVYEGKGTINLPVRRQNASLILREVGEDGQRAVTHWESLGVFQGLSFLKIHLETGRTHQIRVHFSYLGTPILGDTLYSKGDPRIPRQALHCGEMNFSHPVTGAAVHLSAPIPKDIKQLLD